MGDITMDKGSESLMGAERIFTLPAGKRGRAWDQGWRVRQDRACHGKGERQQKKGKKDWEQLAHRETFNRSMRLIYPANSIRLPSGSRATLS